MQWRRAVVCVVVVACAPPSEPPELAQQALAVEGPWQVPEDVLAAGDVQYVAYKGAGPWLEEACAGSLLPGARLLGDALALHFPQVAMIGGYNCRPIRGTSETMSLHGAGRAVDVHIPTLGDAFDADNELGDEVGAFLIAHAELLGVQLVIWDEASWGASRAVGAKLRDYTGVNPHHDHLHVELSVAAAQNEADWFSAALWPEDAGIAVDAAVPDAAVAVADDAALPEPADDAGIRFPIGPIDPVIRPVIEPILDDDPVSEPAPRLPPAQVTGSTCSVSAGAPVPKWPAILPFAWAFLRFRRRRVRKSEMACA